MEVLLCILGVLERASLLSFFSFLFCFVSGRATESGAVRIANRFCGKRLNTLIAYWFWKGCGFREEETGEGKGEDGVMARNGMACHGIAS